VTSPTPYGTLTDLSALAEVCHDRDRPLIVDEAWGAHLPFHPGLYDDALALAAKTRERIDAVDGTRVHGRADFLAPDRAADLDPLQIIVDIAALRTTGYRAADWIREHHHVNLHLVDHRRISAQLTHADDEESAETLIAAFGAVAAHADELRPAPEVAVPGPAALRLEQAALPRDASSGPPSSCLRKRPPGGSRPR
jgi:arginine decarboxylase